MFGDRPASRRGLTSVEFSIVAVPVFLIVFGMIEFGRALMAVHALEEAARSGCRVAILRGANSSEVSGEVGRVLQPVNIGEYTISVDPTDVTSAPRWAPVSVSVEARFSDISWLPLPRYLGEQSYRSTCTLAKEYATGG